MFSKPISLSVHTMEPFDLAFAIESFKAMKQSERTRLFFEMITEQKNLPYSAKEYQPFPRFQTGDEVVVCSHNLYYFATVTNVSEEMDPDWKRIYPCYAVLHRGWKSADPSMMWVMEYDVIGLTAFFQPQEHLAAHWWNVIRLKDVKNLSKKERTGLFKLTHEEMASLENAIKRGGTSMKRAPGTEKWTMKQWLFGLNVDLSPAVIDQDCNKK